MNKSEIAGKHFRATNPIEAAKVVEAYTAILSDITLVEKIYNDLQITHADLDHEERRLLFIAVVYQAFQPLSYLPKIKGDSEQAQAAGKLPSGVRDEMKRTLAYNSAEMINYEKCRTEPMMKPNNNGVVRQFRVDVMAIVDGYRCYSSNKNVLQYSLGI